VRAAFAVSQEMEFTGRLSVGLRRYVVDLFSSPESYSDLHPYRHELTALASEKRKGERSLTLKTLKLIWGRVVVITESSRSE
jgi:hypothetical protein